MPALIIGAALLLALGLLVEERNGLLRVGMPAPDFASTLSDGSPFMLMDYRGKSSVVLFFYPADFSSCCTEQACAFRDGYSEIKEAGAVLFGISWDSDSSHVRFSEMHELPYPLISDSNGAIGKAYGVERLGGWLHVPKRVTYVIDRKGIVRAAIHHEILMHRHVEEVRETLNAIDGK